jgi:hypothetical protein
VERTTRYLKLIHLPGGWKAPQVRNALIPQTAGIPAQLRKTLTCPPWPPGTPPERPVDAIRCGGSPPTPPPRSKSDWPAWPPRCNPNNNGEAGRGNCWAAQIIRDRAEPYAALHIARIAGRDE